MDTRLPLTSLAAAAALIAVSAGASSATTTEAEVSDVVLLVGTDQTQRNVAWYTADEVTGEVQWAPASADGDEDFPANHEVAETTDAGQTHDGRHYHHATMDDLEPGTDYLYRVGSEDSWSEAYEFSTAATDSEFEFLVVGDPQLGSSGDVGADQEGWESTLGTATDMFPDATWVHSVGDQVEVPDSEQEYAALLAPELMRTLPWAFNLGNHDEGSTAFETHFFLPGADEVGYHWYRHGDVLVLGLDSNTLDVDAYDAFLGEVLEEQRQDGDWTVVTFHHSAFGLAEHSNSADMIAFREGMAPLLSEHGVDVAFTGHDHTYARTPLMEGRTPVDSEDPDDLHPDEGQVLHLTLNSASGSKYYPPMPGDDIDAADPHGFDFAEVAWQGEAPSFTHVEVAGDVMTIVTYRADTGDTIDEVVLHRAGAPEPSPEATPSPSPESDESPSPAPDVDAGEEANGVPWVAIAAVAVVLLLAGSLAAIARRRRNRPRDS